MKLYYAPGACSLAPHIVLREAERRFDLERVELASKRTASGLDYLTINPKGSVPALQLDGEPPARTRQRAGAVGEVLTEVSAIVQYLGDLVPERALVPPSGTLARYRLMEWLSFIATELHKQLAPLLHGGLPRAYEEKLRGKVGERFLYLADVLGDRGFLLGETFSVADAYLWTILQWADRSRIELHLWPNLDDYEVRIAQRPAVRLALAAEGLRGRHRQAA